MKLTSVKLNVNFQKLMVNGELAKYEKCSCH